MFICRIRTSECKVVLGIFLYPNLMVSLWGIPHPHQMSVTKGEVSHKVTARDGVGNQAQKSDLMKYNQNKNHPNKVVNVAYMLLMRLGSKKCFEHPFAAVDLTNVAKLCQGQDAFMHNGYFLWAIMYLLDANGMGAPHVYETLVFLDGYKQTLVVKYRPTFLQELVNVLLHWKI
jgi:hypothetical protein